MILDEDSGDNEISLKDVIIFSLILVGFILLQIMYLTRFGRLRIIVQ